MKTFHLVLYIVAAVLFLIAAFAPNAGGVGNRVNFLALGLLAWVLVPLSAAIDSY